MPGLVIWLTIKEIPGAAERFAAAQAAMTYRPDHSCVALHGPPSRVGFVTHPSYPVRQIGNDPISRIFLEGRIYNKSWSVLAQELGSLARAVRDDPRSAFHLIRHWIINTDGEYVATIIIPEQSLFLLFTDPLGCLPLYYHLTATDIIIARECKFILHLLPPPHPYDALGCAQLLWVGYP